MNKLLLVVSPLVDTAANIASLITEDGIECKALCPPKFEGLLRALGNTFSYAHSIVITSDLFADLGTIEVVKGIRRVHTTVQILVLRTGGMELVSEAALKSAGANGAFSAGIARDANIASWIKKSLKKEGSSFVVEKVRRVKRVPVEAGTPDDDNGSGEDADDEDPSPPREEVPTPVKTSSRKKSQPTPEKKMIPVIPPDQLGGVWAKPLTTNLEEEVAPLEESSPSPSGDNEKPGSTLDAPTTPLEESTPLTVSPTPPKGELVVQGLEDLCKGVSNEVVIRAFFSAIRTFTDCIKKETGEEPREVTVTDIVSTNQPYLISVVKLSGRSSHVKLGIREFYMHPSHAEVFKMLVQAKGEVVQLETIQEAFRMKNIWNARHIMIKVIKSLEKDAPELNGCIRNSRGNGYYFALPKK